MLTQTLANHDYALEASDCAFRRFLAPLYDGVKNGTIPTEVVLGQDINGDVYPDDVQDIDTFLETAEVSEIRRILGSHFTDSMARELDSYNALFSLHLW